MAGGTKCQHTVHSAHSPDRTPFGRSLTKSLDPPMFIGCSTNGFYPQLKSAAALAAMGALGVTHAELMLHHQRQYALASFCECGRIARDAGVEIAAVHLKPDAHMLFDPDPGTMADAWQNFDLALAGAREIGARTIVWQGPVRDEYPIESGWDPMLDAVSELDLRCQAAGLRLALENTKTGLFATLRDFIEVTPRLPVTTGFAFDPHHAAGAQMNPMLLLRRMSGRLFDVHLRDFDAEGKHPGNILPGEGTLPWSAILRAVRAAGFDGPLILEAVLQPDPARSLAAVHALLDPILAMVNAGEPGCASSPPPGVLEGIRLFNEGLYYECHEEIEHEWHAETGDIRNLYQGILQIGVGFHHASNGNLRGACLLLNDGLDKVGRFLPTCQGIDTQQLWDESMVVLSDIRARLGAKQSAPLVLVFPTIRFS